MEENLPLQQDEVIIGRSTGIERKLKNLINSDNTCGLCCFEESKLISINQHFEVAGDFGVHTIVLREIISYVIKNRIEDMATTCICEKCLNQIYNSYLFIRNTDYNLTILVKYIDNIDYRAQEVTDLGDQEKLNIVCHREVNDTDNCTETTLESGFKCCKCEKVLDNFDDLKKHENGHRWTFKVKCKICKESVYFKVYNQHLRMKHPDEAYSCPHCYSAYIRKKDFQSHLKRHTKKKVMKKSNRNDGSLIEGAKCGFCSEELNESNYKTHKCQSACTECDVLQCVHYEYLIVCRTQGFNRKLFRCTETACDYVCQKKKYFIAHLNRNHLDYHPYTCDICKQEFYSKELMKKHIITYHQETYFCYYCCTDFSNEKDSYKSHLVMCQSVERDFKCSDCEASFDKEEELSQHLLNCRRYCCQSCNHRFAEQRKLFEHTAKVHKGLHSVAKYPKNLKRKRTNNKQVTCSECGVSCSKSSLKTHILEKHPDIQAKFICEFCEKVFRSYRDLRIHKQRHTKQVKCTVCSKLVYEGRMTGHLKYHFIQSLNLPKGPQCSYCDYRVSARPSLEAHINQVHLKIKPYHCELCDKKFCGKIDLDNHIESHTRPQQIICEICSKPLCNNRSYKKHMAKHTGVKPFKCEQCGEAFHSLGELNYHKKKHTREKNVSCPMPHCKTKFYLTTNMRSHFKKVHWKQKDKPFDPKLVQGLDEKYYHLFEDRRCRKISPDVG